MAGLGVNGLTNTTKTETHSQGSKFIFGFGSICATRCNFLVTELGILGAQLQTLGAPTQKKYLTLQKEQIRLCVAKWAFSNTVEHNENK